MASLQSLAKKRVDMYQIDPHDLHIEYGWNVRQEGPELEAHIRGLCDSIKERGVLEPLTVYLKDGQPTVINGHCRLAAVMLAISEGAEIKTIPVRVEEKGYNDADRTLSMIVRNSGKPLTPLELALVVQRLMGYGWVISDIAKRTGFSRTYIDNLLAMCAAPEEVKALIKDGKVAPATAMKVLKNEGEVKGTKMLKKAVQQQAELGKDKVTEKHIKAAEPTLPAAAAAPQPVSIDTMKTDTLRKWMHRFHDAKSKAELSRLQELLRAGVETHSTAQ